MCFLLSLLLFCSFVFVGLLSNSPVFPAAAPITFKKGLKSQEATEGGRATLSCETSSPECKVTWRKGSQILNHGVKYNMEKNGATHSLVIHKLNAGDSGEYTCDTGDKHSTASLTVKGNSTSSSPLVHLSPLTLYEVHLSFIHLILVESNCHHALES